MTDTPSPRRTLATPDADGIFRKPPKIGRKLTTSFEAHPLVAGNGTDFVWVGCALPNGYVCQIDEKYEENEMGRDGSRLVVKHRPILRGHAPLLDMSPAGLRQPQTYPILMPYGLTRISRAFWEVWFKQSCPTGNLEDPETVDVLKNGMVFAQPTEADASAVAREYQELKTGYEPADPSNPTQRAAYGGPIPELKKPNVRFEKGDRA
jgi:hypothetical protein